MAFIVAAAFWVQDVVGYQFTERFHSPQFTRTAGLLAATITWATLVWLGTQVD